MTAAQSESTLPPSRSPRPQFLPPQATFARVFHWINLISLWLMVFSGLQIYNANPVFGGRSGWHFPSIFLLGGWLAGGRHWHFAAIWFFSLNLLAYGVFVLWTRRWRIRYVSGKDLKALQQSQNPQRRAYAWHRILYTIVIFVLLLALLSGLGMYKPAQFPWIVDLFGDWQALRTVHFLSVPVLALFAAAHSWLALRVGGDRLVLSMLR